MNNKVAKIEFRENFFKDTYFTANMLSVILQGLPKGTRILQISEFRLQNNHYEITTQIRVSHESFPQLKELQAIPSIHVMFNNETKTIKLDFSEVYENDSSR